MNIDEIRYSLQHLVDKKLRSFLTIISIVIGIMAIFALISFGIGIKNYTQTLANEAGADKLMIMAKGFTTDSTGGFKLTADDISFIQRISGVKEAAGVYSNVGQLKHDRDMRFVDMVGLDTKHLRLVEEIMTTKIVEGRQLKTDDTEMVVLGYNYLVADKIFAKPLHVGDKITINDRPFDVVGFYDEIGTPSDDSQVYMTFEGMESLYPTQKDIYIEGFIQADKGISTSDLADIIKEKMRKRLGEDKGNEDFFVQSFQDLLATFDVILNVINGILILIALVSVVVASVNITNTMYTAVLERTKEIGIMKAIGAKNEDILFIFIFESGLLGLMGGVIGVGMGFLVASTGGAIAASAGYALLKPEFPWYLIMGCILFAFMIGAGSGIFPARQAADQKPVDSLRYE
jgi:putative ABC transport system permease protein